MADPALDEVPGPLGSLFGGGPDGSMSDGGDDRPAPHVVTFASLLNQFSRSYSYRSDEALKNNPMNALAMRRDALYRALLQERLLPTARRKWQLEVDEPKDPRQREVKEGLTTSIKAIGYFARMRFNLLEAEWYGRYGVQGTWEQRPDVKDKAGKPLYVFSRPQPVNGDKIQFQWDGTPAVMVGMSHKWPANSIVYGDRAPLLRLDRPAWRRQFVIHKFNPEDADYFEGDMAGAVNGVGLRSMIYWSWWMREEMLGWCVDFMQKVGTLGLLVFWYESGNKDAKLEAWANAKSASNRAAFVMPRPAGKTDMPPGGVEQIAPQTGGIEALQDMISNYWERHQERLIVGQSMSSGKDEGDGLGGTGRADFAKDTKYQILAYSAENLDETLTEDLVRVAKHLNYPDADFPVRFKSIVPDPEKADKLKTMLEVIKILAVPAEDLRELAEVREGENGEEMVGGPPQTPGLPGAVPGAVPGVNGQPTTGAPLGGLLGDANGDGAFGGLLGDPAPLGGLLGRGVNGNGKVLGGLVGNGTAGAQHYAADAKGNEHSPEDGRFTSKGGGGKAATKAKPKAADHPLGTDEATVRKNLLAEVAKLRDGADDPRGYEKAKPDAATLDKVAAAVEPVVAAHAAKTTVGLPIAEVYDAVKGDIDLTPHEFHTALYHLREAGRVRLSGWAKSPGEMPRPEHTVPVGSREMYYVQPS